MDPALQRLVDESAIRDLVIAYWTQWYSDYYQCTDILIKCGDV